MISVKSIQNIVYSDYDEVWAIVRYMKTKIFKTKPIVIGEQLTNIKE